ncbi:MAG: YqgE/AlgH family protein [Cyclobacteriaceae bacterium]|nr:YqgE/AlgH family protein [Cyclobacteriaceae bacterium SS2]
MDYFGDDLLTIPRKGDLLISEPYLPDPNFERTVIFLCEHDENGSLGFVLNKKSKAVVNDLMDELDSFNADIFVGGPVQRNTLHFLHKGNTVLDADVKVVEGIHWGMDFEGLMEKINTGQVSEQDIKFFVGYSGWSPGQLLEELKEKTWIVCKCANQDLVFDTDPEDLWSVVLKNMGGKFKVMANYPRDPRLN